MPDDNPDETDSGGKHTGEKLTPRTAYRLTEEQGMTQSEVGEMFGVSQPRVSTLKSQYESARDEGAESVTPDQFEPEELKEALNDSEPDENPYEGTDCPRCGKEIPATKYPSEPGVHDCPHCGEPIQWSEQEL